MVQADSHDTRIAPQFPALEILNATLDPAGDRVAAFIREIYKPAEIEAFTTVFVLQHLIANEIERLMAILDRLSGEEDLELSFGSGSDDPRLNECEGEDGDSELSLGSVCADDRGNQTRWAAGDNSAFHGDWEADHSDDEPSLGASESVNQTAWGRPGEESDDREEDRSDDEPSLSGINVERGDDRDLEADLGSFDRMVDQTKSLHVRSGAKWPVQDGELSEVTSN